MDSLAKNEKFVITQRLSVQSHMPYFLLWNPKEDILNVFLNVFFVLKMNVNGKSVKMKNCLTAGNTFLTIN